ncbi:MAG: SET domain-containing protein [Chlamydiales bacterium]|nr:SET domain-containing protein [Chlamydiales bacterium]
MTSFNLIQAFYDPEIKPLLEKSIQLEFGSLAPLTKEELKEIASLKEPILGGGIPKHLVRKKLNKDLGYGIFLHPKASPLVKGQVIAPYAGEISLVPQNAPDESAYAFSLIENLLLDREEQRYWDKARLPHPKRLYSFKLDAWKKGNFTRYINHSDKPNLAAYTVCIPNNHYGIAPSLIEVVYFVKKKIRPGEQLLVSYEVGANNFWNGGKGKPFPMTPQTFQL